MADLTEIITIADNVAGFNNGFILHRPFVNRLCCHAHTQTKEEIRGLGHGDPTGPAGFPQRWVRKL